MTQIDVINRYMQLEAEARMYQLRLSVNRTGFVLRYEQTKAVVAFTCKLGDIAREIERQKKALQHHDEASFKKATTP
jgi:hypothetical protein